MDPKTFLHSSIIILLLTLSVHTQKAIPFDPATCSISAEIKQEISNYKNVVGAIMSKIMKGNLKGVAYTKLADFVDTFGARVGGSLTLEKAFDYLQLEMIEIGLTNVHTEAVFVPKWMSPIEPWEKPILSKAVRYSISTPPDGITAQVIVLHSEDELEKSPEKFKGKIIGCFCELNPNLIGRMAKLGALAVLIGDPEFGIYGIHDSGRIIYNDSYPKIPVTLITPQDMRLLSSIYRRKSQKLVMQLTMQEPIAPINVLSKNIFGDYPGNTIPGEIYGLAAHVDTAELGQGAQDDGFAVIFVLETIKLFRDMNLKPKRTLRAMLWTGEELGRLGSSAYLAAHAKDLKNFQAVMESDSGCMSSIGLLYKGTRNFGCIMYEVHKLLKQHVESLDFSYRRNWLSDMELFADSDIPTLGLKRDPKYYRWYQHTNADTMTAVKSSQLDKCFATFAAVSYVISDISEKMPRD